MKIIFFTIALSVMIPFASLIVEAKPSVNLIKNFGFEASMDGWKSMGQAQFGLDSSFKHSGVNSLRIRIEPATGLEYQRVYYTIPVKPGQVYKGRFWVYYTKLSDGIGAYGVLEFLNSKGSLGSGVHSEPIPNVGRPNEWHALDNTAEVPEGATEMRLMLVMHSHGTAWFDDVEVIRLRESPAKDQIPVKLSLKPKEIINREWRGFGFQGDLFLNYKRLKDLGVDDEDRKLVRRRILEMRPQMVRLCVNLTDWEDKKGIVTSDTEAIIGLKETLAIYKEAGADIQLTEWGYRLPAWCRPADRLPHPDERRAFTDSWVSLIKYLRKDCGFTNIRYFTYL
ncbi:MAG: carbohydrate binding domain-containing protein, partial [Armatimonadota bacterium]